MNDSIYHLERTKFLQGRQPFSFESFPLFILQTQNISIYMGKDEFIYIKSSVLSNKLELETRSRAVCYARLVELKNLILWKQFD